MTDSPNTAVAPTNSLAPIGLGLSVVALLLSIGMVANFDQILDLFVAHDTIFLALFAVVILYIGFALSRALLALKRGRGYIDTAQRSVPGTGRVGMAWLAVGLCYLSMAITVVNLYLFCTGFFHRVYGNFH